MDGKSMNINESFMSRKNPKQINKSAEVEQQKQFDNMANWVKEISSREVSDEEALEGAQRLIDYFKLMLQIKARLDREKAENKQEEVDNKTNSCNVNAEFKENCKEIL